jgi:hypothetical protein
MSFLNPILLPRRRILGEMIDDLDHVRLFHELLLDHHVDRLGLATFGSLRALSLPVARLAANPAR